MHTCLVRICYHRHECCQTLWFGCYRWCARLPWQSTREWLTSLCCRRYYRHLYASLALERQETLGLVDLGG
jgi:hypothetical protein